MTDGDLTIRLDGIDARLDVVDVRLDSISTQQSGDTATTHALLERVLAAQEAEVDDRAVTRDRRYGLAQSALDGAVQVAVKHGGKIAAVVGIMVLALAGGSVIYGDAVISLAGAALDTDGEPAYDVRYHEEGP